MATISLAELPSKIGAGAPAPVVWRRAINRISLRRSRWKIVRTRFLIVINMSESCATVFKMAPRICDGPSTLVKELRRRLEYRNR